MLSINIRPAERNDLPEIMRLCREHARFEQTSVGAGLSDLLDDLIFGESAAISCAVAETEGAIAGYTTSMQQFSTWEARPYLYVDCLFVSPAYRGHGIGRKMMDLLAETALRKGFASLQWQTPATNQRAIQFYLTLGAKQYPKSRFVWDVENVRPKSANSNDTKSTSSVP